MWYIATLVNRSCQQYSFFSRYSLRENCYCKGDVNALIEQLGESAMKKGAMIEKLKVSIP